MRADTWKWVHPKTTDNEPREEERNPSTQCNVRASTLRRSEMNENKNVRIEN